MVNSKILTDRHSLVESKSCVKSENAVALC